MIFLSSLNFPRDLIKITLRQRQSEFQYLIPEDMLKKYHTFEIANAVSGTFTRDPNN